MAAADYAFSEKEIFDEMVREEMAKLEMELRSKAGADDYVDAPTRYKDATGEPWVGRNFLCFPHRVACPQVTLQKGKDLILSLVVIRHMMQFLPVQGRAKPVTILKSPHKNIILPSVLEILLGKKKLPVSAIMLTSLQLLRNRKRNRNILRQIPVRILPSKELYFRTWAVRAHGGYHRGILLVQRNILLEEYFQ